MVTKRRSEDEEYIEPQQAVSASSISGVDVGGPEISEVLLELISGIAKLSTLLKELNQDEFVTHKTRLDSLFELIDKVPRSVPPKRKLGFTPPRKKT